VITTPEINWLLQNVMEAAPCINTKVREGKILVSTPNKKNPMQDAEVPSLQHQHHTSRSSRDESCGQHLSFQQPDVERPQAALRTGTNNSPSDMSKPADSYAWIHMVSFELIAWLDSLGNSLCVSNLWLTELADHWGNSMCWTRASVSSKIKQDELIVLFVSFVPPSQFASAQVSWPWELLGCNIMDGTSDTSFWRSPASLLDVEILSD
jgi:hypothetical protein